VSTEPHEPLRVEIDSIHVGEETLVHACEHARVTLRPDALVRPGDAETVLATLTAIDARAAAIYRILTTGSPEPVWPAARWVLVKGYHDSGTIDGVFGPYTEAHADWLLSTVLDLQQLDQDQTQHGTGGLDHGQHRPRSRPCRLGQRRTRS